MFAVFVDRGGVGEERIDEVQLASTERRDAAANAPDRASTRCAGEHAISLEVRLEI